MYGWRLRLGVLVPCVNSVVEPEFSIMAPEGVSTYCSRMIMSGGTKIEQLLSMEDSIENSTLSLNDVVDIYAYACTSGSFLKGPEWDIKITNRIKELSGKETVSTSGALVEALNTIGVKKLVLATPYIKEINQRQIRYLEEFGFEICYEKGLEITNRGGAGLCYPDIAYKLGTEVAGKVDADALVISCTNFRTIDIIPKLEADLGIPVISSNQATFWACLRKGGIKENLIGYGTLLANY